MKINRAKLRGKKLDNDCQHVNYTQERIDRDTIAIYCYGMYDLCTECLMDKCKRCGAHVDRLMDKEGNQ